ncbi:hypothetical protein ABZT16_03255 [Streptomyces flaveolus]|uniref:Uncharacterized protein n=1 Tax=Streptomyces flaveolus TaxID=67297 RepID=A0ABV3A4J8_9ACTN|nr:hypothetical protein [Streptomyces antibioticus]
MVTKAVGLDGTAVEAVVVEGAAMDAVGVAGAAGEDAVMKVAVVGAMAVEAVALEVPAVVGAVRWDSSTRAWASFFCTVALAAFGPLAAASA